MVEPDAVLEVANGILDLGVAAMVGLQFQWRGRPVLAGAGSLRGGPISLNVQGGRLSGLAIKRMVKIHAAAAGLVSSAVHPYTLRHSCTTHLLKGGDRRQLVLPVTSTIFAGRDGVIIRYGGTVDYRPTNQAIEAETYGRQDTGNGSGQGWDERAFSAQVAERPIAVPTPSTGCGRMRLSRCCGMIRRAS